MRYSKNLICLALIVNLLSFVGCAQRPPSPLEKTNLEKEFLESFNKTTKVEYPLYTNTKIVGKTFWVYIGTEKEIMQISSASGMGGFMPDKLIKFMDIQCQYENSEFNINYVFLKYSDEEKSMQQDVLRKAIGGTTLFQDFTNETIEILQKTYFSIGDIIADTQNLNFFAICLANIKKGIKIIFVIHRLDIEQFLLNMLPSDEFYNRMIIKTEGSKETINDKYGISIDYSDISLTDFLEEQIVNNAKAKINEMEKYNPEQLKSLDKLDDILLESTYDVTTKYEFTDYLIVEVQNLITRENLSLSKSKLTKRFGAPSEDYYLEDSNF
ncbi:MAG: hypothetical protein ABIA97_04380 [Candidatus Omnitrophota bacterium]